MCVCVGGAECIEAMVEHTYDDKVDVIVQGSAGDHFYMTSLGKFEAYARSDMEGDAAAIATRRSSTTADDEAPGAAVNNELGFAVLQQFGPAEGFGELALMYNSPRACSVRAIEPRSIAFSLERQAFRQLVMSHNSGVKHGLEKVCVQQQQQQQQQQQRHHACRAATHRSPVRLGLPLVPARPRVACTLWHRAG